MTLPSRLAVCWLVALMSVSEALPQDSKDKDRSSDEDAKLVRLIERWIQLNETERDHVLREVSRNNNGKTDDDDFTQWFTRLGGDDEGWDRTRTQRKNATEIFDRIAVTGPILSRAQFIGYAKEFWRKGKSPPWREPPPFETGAEAANLFDYLDRDHDSYLSSAEMPPALRVARHRWDRDNDGWISQGEYRSYFAHRLDRTYRELQQRADRSLPPLEIAAPAGERPMVTRPGNLPLGLPAWFDQLDTDRDTQIGAFEWRRAAWPLEEFAKIDLNDNGFIEPHEILKLLATTEPDGNHPFAYLLQNRVAGPAAKKQPPCPTMSAAIGGSRDFRLFPHAAMLNYV